MEMQRETAGAGAGPVITGFSGRGFKVGEQLFPAGLWIDPEQVQDWPAPANVEQLDVALLAPLLHRNPPPEFLLLGTGAQLRRPPRAFVASLEALGIGLEAMDSRAAARAWGVLRLEGRQIVGVLMPL